MAISKIEPASLQYQAGTGPAFSAYRSGTNQSVSPSTWTKVQLNTEVFDTAGAFDSTTNYRFQPTIAGYYQFNGGIYFSNSSGGTCYVAFYKNGLIYSYGTSAINPQDYGIGSSLIYLNGSTDYVELYGYVTVASNFRPEQTITFISGSLARAA